MMATSVRAVKSRFEDMAIAPGYAVSGTAPSAAPARLGARRAPEDDAELLLEMREGIGGVRDRHRVDEMRLESRLERRLDLLDAAHHLADLAARGGVEERDAGAGARRIAGGRHLVERAVGDQAERHRVERIDMAAEGAGKRDARDLVDA